jgi:hypothetical protein
MSSHEREDMRATKSVLAMTVLTLTLFAALPANAALFQRHSDGSVSIDPLLCLTNYQVRQAVAARGFTHIFLNAPIETQIQVKATRGGTVYLIDFDRCAGQIDGIQRLR